MPESKSILPFPYFFDRDFAKVDSSFSKSDSVFFNRFSDSSNLILLIIKLPRSRVN